MLTSPDVQFTAPDQGMPVDAAKLAAFMSSLCRKRDKAIEARRSSGIEAEWLEDEEFYLGIDDANRQFQRAATIMGQGKAFGALGGTRAVDPEGASRSSVFLNITRPYVDAAAARLADMLLPSDESCWAIKPTPIAEITDYRVMVALRRLGIDWKDEQAKAQKEAEAKAEAMTTEIDDHLVECNWNSEVRNVIEDAARIGSGIVKGPFAQKKTFKKWTLRDGMAGLEIKVDIQPGSKCISPWDFYPDGGCGENIHNGSETWERGYITAKMLRDMGQVDHLTRMPLVAGYIPDAIAQCLSEGPQKQTTSRMAGDGTYIPAEGQFEMWTFYGVISKDDAIVSGLDLNDQTPIVNAMALLVNDRIIKITLNSMDTGEFPYDLLAWQRRPGLPWGMGLARHIRTPQRMLNGAVRAMMDNAGDLKGPQEVIGNGITPLDGKWEVRGKKMWRADPTVVDITKSFYCYVPKSVIAELMQIIELARSLAEQTTGMPMLLQGQASEVGGQGASTLGGMQLLQNNATGVLRRLAKRFDDYLTEPHIRRYYNWLMQYSEREEIKGDFQIDVRASSALVERDSQKQFMFAAMNFAPNPVYRINPAKLFAELARSDRMDPEKIQYTDAEFAALQQQGPSELDQAKATLALAQAETEKARAETEKAKAVLTKVESLFSAINTANLVAQNPAIAPAADQTALSAGFVDANAPPIVAEVPPGAQPTPMPQNTSPTFPANPPMPEGQLPVEPQPEALPMPDVGAQAGIEGGQT